MAKLTDAAKKLFENLTIFYHLKQMPQSQRDTFFGLKKKKLLSKELEKWEVYMDHIKNNTIPAELNFSNISDDDDKKEIYERLQDWFQTLSEDEDLKSESDVKDFISKYNSDVGQYGVEGFDDTDAKDIATAIDKNLNAYSQVLGIPVKDLKTLKDDLSSGKYKTNKTTHEICSTFLSKLESLEYSSNKEKLIPLLPDFLKEDSLNREAFNKLSEDFSTSGIISSKAETEIAKALDGNEKIYSSKMGMKESDLITLKDALKKGSYKSNDTEKKLLIQFLLDMQELGDSEYEDLKKHIPEFLKSNGVNQGVLDGLILKNNKRVSNPPKGTDFDKPLQEMFEKLASNKKLRDKVLPHAGDINTLYNKGAEKANYDEGKTKLDHKLNYKKNIFKRGIEKLNEHMTETVGKLADRHNRHKYQDVCAEETVGALINNGAKPSDGTEKLLDKLKAVQKSVSQKSQSKLDWGIKELDKLSKAGYFKEALRKGRDMRQMVEQIVLDAAHDGKKEEAKTLLETLAVMRYSPVSSSVRDDLRTAEINIFSGTSLAKENDFMGNFMGALDKTIRWAGLGMFEIANFTKNMINSAGARVYKRRLDESTKDSEEFKDKDKHEDMTELFNFWNLANGVRSHTYNILRRKSKSKAPDFTKYNNRHIDRFS